MTAPQDDPDADLATAAFQTLEYRGARVQRDTAGRIGKPPGRPLYQYWAEVYRRRIVRHSLQELKRAIDEALDS